MWSHYADEHKGQVIEFDVLKDLDFFSLPVDISYQDNYQPLDYLADSEASAKRNLSIKAKVWEYEEEVRILKKFVGRCAIKGSAITKVYFGCVCVPGDKQKVINLCHQEYFSNIKFFEAFKRHGKFELGFHRKT